MMQARIRQPNTRHHIRMPWLAAVSALLLAVMSPEVLAARTWDGGAGTSNWTDANNWNADGVPSAEGATINLDNAAVTLNSAANDITYLYIATSSSGTLTSSLTIGSGGSLTQSSNALSVGANSSTGSTFGTLTLDGGSLTISVSGGSIGSHTSTSVSGGRGTLNINAGNLTFYSGLSIGVNNVFGEVIQTGGAVTNIYNQGGLTIGRTTGTVGDGNARGAYDISAGSMSLPGMLYVGSSGRSTSAVNVGDAMGVFTQTGGDVALGTATTGANVDKGLQVGVLGSFGPFKGTDTGVYKLLGGTLTASGISIGMNANYEQTYSGSGTFEFGNADATATLQQRSGGARNILVRTSAYSDGTFTGWGTVGFTGTLTNNGRVIANGFGTSRSLDFSGMAAAANTIENASGTAAQNDTINGWYAINKGKLLLPGVTVSNSAGTFSYNLGEGAADADIDMVNSVRVTLTKAATTGTQKVNANLYDKDHSSAPAMAGFPVVGMWEITPTFAVSTANMVFRYDDALAASLGVAEAGLQVFHYNTGTSTWEPLANCTVDTTNKRIAATGVTSFGFFAASIPPYDLITDFGVDLFYKTYWGNLTVTPLGNGTSRITRSGGDEFTAAFEGKMFESARIHKNPATYPSSGANYIPKATTVRYATVTTVESATSLVVNFEYNGGNDVTPQATTSTDGIFFANNKTAFQNYVANGARKAECRWNGVLAIFGIPNVTATSDLAFKDLSGGKDNIYLKFLYSDDFNVSADGNVPCPTWATQYGSLSRIFSFGNADIDIDLPQILPTLYTTPSVQYVTANVDLLYDTGSTTSTATGHKKTWNWQQYKERDEMAAALGSVRSGASFNLPNLGYSMGGGTHDGTDITAFNVYEIDGGWSSLSPMNFKAKYKSGILFWVHGTENERADFSEKASLKATSYAGIQTKFTDNRTCVTSDSLFTFYQMCNQYWLGGTSTSSTAPNELRISLGGTEYTLYFGNRGDWRHEAQSTTIPTVIIDGQTAKLFDRIPATNDVITLGIGNLGGFKSANVIRVWGWAMTVGTQLSISGSTYTITAISRQYTNDGTYGGYSHYFDCTLSGTPAQAGTATVVSSPLSALLDGNYRSASHVYNRDANGHLCYTDQETNMRWENVNYSGHVRATGEYDGTDDLYKMTSIAEFTNVFCVNEDGTPRYSQGREWNPASLRRRQLLTSNNNYRVKISGGRIFWNRYEDAKPEVIFTNRPHLIYGTASYGEPRLLNPIMGDTQGLILGSGDGSSTPVSTTGCSIVLANGHSVNLANSELRGQVNLAGHGSVDLSNVDTMLTPGSQTQYYGFNIAGAINGFTIPTLNLSLTGDGGEGGFRQIATYAIGNLVFNLTNWTIRPTYYCADGFTSMQDTQHPDYGDYISINGQVLY